MNDGPEHPESLPAVRHGYGAVGVEGYYRLNGAFYRNPHEPVIRRSLRTLVPGWGLDLSHVLDLAAGSGEVTLALREMGAGRVDGADPYTHAAYESRTAQSAERISFEDVAAGALAGRRYSLVVCSFAMHLCEGPRLPGVAAALSLAAPSLVILTPHKRPVLRPEWGWDLADERVVERVRTRWYRSRNAG